MYQYLLRSTNSNLCRSTLPTIAIAVFGTRFANLKKKKEISSFFFKSDENGSLGSTLELWYLPWWWWLHLHNACRNVTEKESRKNNVKEVAGTGNIQLMEKESSTAAVLLMYSTDYANNPGVSWIIGSKYSKRNIEMPEKIFDAIFGGIVEEKNIRIKLTLTL